MSARVLTPFPYYGGKMRMMEFILEYLPPANRLIDLFGGSAVVSINSYYRFKRILYNDIHSELVNFFRVLRDDGDRLIGWCRLTPASREEYDNAFMPSDDPVEQARRTFIKITQSFASAGLHSKTGWSTPTAGACLTRTIQNKVDGLIFIKDILQMVDIENRDWREIVEKYGAKDAVIFADPPYDLSVRAGGKTYRDEMSEADHRDLADALNKSPARALVCGYHSDLYDAIYADWHCKELEINCPNVTKDHREKGRVECLWIKP